MVRGKWLENVDQTHLVLASGKPILQKIVKVKHRGSTNASHQATPGSILGSPVQDSPNDPS